MNRVEVGKELAGSRVVAQEGRNQQMKYKIVLRKSKEGCSVCCPALPGCWSQGRTEKEALRNIRHAIREYLAAVEASMRGADVREIQVRS